MYVIDHELSHCAHWKVSPEQARNRELDDPEHSKIARKVSIRASESPSEFVAETRRR